MNCVAVVDADVKYRHNRKAGSDLPDLVELKQRNAYFIYVNHVPPCNALIPLAGRSGGWKTEGGSLEGSGVGRGSGRVRAQ